MENWQRSHKCSELNLSLFNKTVTVNGWLSRIRSHGKIYFINLRDRYGEIQITIDTSSAAISAEFCSSLKMEYCLAVSGLVKARPADMINPDMHTGALEIEARSIEILNRSLPLPFLIDNSAKVELNEALRMEYRYLDLRMKTMQERLILRHKLVQYINKFLSSKDFLSIETPTLISSSPEGARDFLVPSRIHKGSFYALAQSPQLYKQALMAAGFEKYFQIARCYRDEDARGDRQPEFTQLDLELSFVNKDDILKISEELMREIFQELLKINLPVKFPQITYKEAMNRYGSDKPDLRFTLEIQDFAPYLSDSNFGVFKDSIAQGGNVFCLVAPEADKFTRKYIGQLEEQAKLFGAQGLAWTKVQNKHFEGGIARFFNQQFAQIETGLGLEENNILFFVAADWQITCEALGAVRLELAKFLKLIDKDKFCFAWIIDFPLFVRSKDAALAAANSAWEPAHHMFSMPKDEYLADISSDPASVLAEQYDLVLNGYELASGSLRIHNLDLQLKVLDIVGFDQEEAYSSFGFLLEALQYGTPPHGGIAFGLDRLLMLMSKCNSIKDVIAFPKNNNGASLLDKSPRPVSHLQLEDLGLANLRDAN